MRMRLRRRGPWRAACLVAIAACVWTACGDGGAGPGSAPTPTSDRATDVPPASTRLVPAPQGLGLTPVTLPDVADMDGPARAQIETASTALAARVDDPQTTPAALGAAYGALGQLLMAATHFDAAEACYRNAETLVPDDRRWPYYLGQIYKVIGPLDQAVAAFQRALALAPTDVATLVGLGEVHLAEGQPETAGPLFARALTVAPGSVAARFGAGRVALEEGDFAGAARELEQALAGDPRATGINYPLGMAYRGLGNAEQAELYLARRGDVNPTPIDPLMDEINGLLQSPEAFDVRGGQAMDVGDWSAAADYFQQGLDLDPDNASLRHRLGTALYQLGDVAGAEAQFVEVVRRSPSHSRAQFSLGVLMAARASYDDAIERFLAALEQDPGYLQARMQLATVLVRAGRAEEALGHYDRSIALDPTLVDATFGAAMALVRLERYSEARDRLSGGMETFPEYLQFAHALARLLAAAPDDRVRDGRRAQSLLEPLLAQDQSIDLGETIAMTLAELGEFPQAAAVQRDVMAAAEQAGLDDVVARMVVNLQRYERGEPCRTPWTESELP